MLNITNASIAFGDHRLFSGLDLNVGRGCLVGLTGESGCGKTSLLRAIMGFVPLSEGTIEVDGLPLCVENVHAIRRRTAYVPQELLPPAATGRDVVCLTHELAANQPHAKLDEVVALMSSLGLETSLLELAAAKLSGGQRQRLMLASALALHKQLLLLDEPTSALDEESTQHVARALHHACHDEQLAALAISHDPALLAACDLVITLSAPTPSAAESASSVSSEHISI